MPQPLYSKAAYAAYCKRMPNGKYMPQFEGLQQNERQAWDAAAWAAIGEFIGQLLENPIGKREPKQPDPNQG